MSDQTAQPETQEQRTQRQLAALREISDLAVLLARRTAEEALKTPPEPAGKPSRHNPRLLFERLAKCLRETIILENRIAGVITPPPPHPAPYTNGARQPWPK